MRLSARDVLLVAVLFATAQYEVWVGPLFSGLSGPKLANAAVLAIVFVPLLWRRSKPVAAFAVVVVAAALHVKIEHQAWVVAADEGLMQVWFALLVAFYSLAANANPRSAAVAGLAGGAGLVINDLPQLLTGVTTLDHTLPAWFILGGSWGLGYALRGRQMQVQALADHNARLEREREVERIAAVAAERVRIARELHDVVAHSLSVMVVQAQAAERVLEGEQPSTREALAAIDATGREALVEMRRLVGMLRDDAGDTTPQPGLGQLDALLDQVREAGLPVELTVVGAPRPLPAGVDLAAYRIVQEGLTNVLKHAGPAHARLTLRYAKHEMELEVVDDGRGPVNGAVGGHGLAGMRERVTVFGGTLESGPVNGRGFRVRARLPT
jgi:signal transduction histidine kinase